MQRPIQQHLFSQPTINSVMSDLASAMDQAVDGSGLTREQAVDRMNKFATRFGIRLVPGSHRTNESEH